MALLGFELESVRMEFKLLVIPCATFTVPLRRLRKMTSSLVGVFGLKKERSVYDLGCWF